MTEIGKTCRGCAGSGISATASPREAQIAQQTIYLTKRWESKHGGIKSLGQINAKAKITEQPVADFADSRDPRSSRSPMERVTRAHARVDAWEGTGGVHKGRLAMSGPLGHVIAHLRDRIADGYTIDEASISIPDLERLRCEWCGGFGVAGEVLTAHTMQEAIEIGGAR